MKFCPQCGTTFESGARFCLECGFDRSTVEPMDQTGTTGSANETNDTEIKPVEPVVEASLPNTSSPACPQCGSALVPEDRFCQECGFDTSVLSATVSAEIPKPVEPVIVEETFIPPAVVEQPVSPPVHNQFCPQCGFSFDSGNRFCPDCGFDTQAPVVAKTTVIPSVVQPVPPPPAPKQTKPEPAYVPPVRQQEIATHPRKKKTWLWLLIAVLALGALGVVGWYGYNNYFNKPKETPVDTTANQVISDIPAIDTTKVAPEVTEQPAAETTPEQLKATTKPLSRIDQELAKQKAKQQQNKPAQPTNTPSQPTKTDVGKITSIPTNPTGNDKMAKVIMEIGKKEDPKNKNPKNPSKLMIQKPTMIVRITTDHYNDGMGTSAGGTISIKDRDGNLIGTYRASGKSGKNGTPNAKWVIEPRKKLEKGTYFIWDSDMSTWSKNFVGNGFVVVEGYEVE